MSEINCSKAGLTGGTSSPVTTRPSAVSLARCAAELEWIMLEIDAADGEIADALIQRFDDARLAVSEKTDRWIMLLDTLKGMDATLRERRDRAAKALKTAENVHDRLKEYLRYVLTANPGVPFKGSDGTLYLHNNAESVKYTIAFEDKTLRNCVDRALVDMEASIRPYVKTFEVAVLDGAKVKADLKAGMKLPWAELHRGAHVRVKG